MAEKNSEDLFPVDESASTASAGLDAGSNSLARTAASRSHQAKASADANAEPNTSANNDPSAGANQCRDAKPRTSESASASTNAQTKRTDANAGATAKSAENIDPKTATTNADAAVNASAGTPIRLTWVRTETRQRIGKRQVQSGKWPVTGGAKSSRFIFEAAQYPDLEAFGRDYAKRQKQGCWSIVAGDLRPGLDPTKSHARNGRNLVDAPRTTLTLDFDGLTPDEGGPALDVPDLIEPSQVALSRLPKAFEGAAHLFLPTSSTGLPVNAKGEPSNGCARFRMTFELTRPLTYAQQKRLAEQMKSRPGLGCIDISLYDKAMFEFVARPDFLSSVRDPAPNAVGMVEGERLDVDALIAEINLDLEAAKDAASATLARAPGAPPILPAPLEVLEPSLRAMAASIVNGPAFDERAHWVRHAHVLANVFGKDRGREHWYEFCDRWVGGDGNPIGNDPDEDKRVWDTLNESDKDVWDLCESARLHGGDRGWRSYCDFLITLFPDLPEAETEAELGAQKGPTWMRDMNALYAFVLDRPGVVLDLRGTDTAILQALSRREFDNIFANKFALVPAGKDKQGNKKFKRVSLSQAWWRHPLRREYATAGNYPIGREPRGALNLWTGLAVDPKQGKWPTIEEFLRDVICDSDPRSYDYLLNLMFWKIQNPTENPEVAISMQGKPGCGKGTFALNFARIFGSRRYQQFTRTEDATAKFNADFEGKVVLFYDEALFGHDPRLRGRLKGEITEPWLAIERKGVDRYHVRNIALRIVASNERAPIPIDLNDRRIFALSVSDAHAKDYAYFRALRAAIEGDEMAAFVADALAADLAAFEATRREPPKTKARARLAAATAKPHYEYLHLLLDGGRPVSNGLRWDAHLYPRVSPEPPEPWRHGQIIVGRDATHQDYLAWMREPQHRQPPINGTEFHDAMQEVLGPGCYHAQWVKRSKGKGKQDPFLLLASLRDCRAAFDAHVGFVNEWDDTP
jgi:hypothetical protein